MQVEISRETTWNLDINACNKTHWNLNKLVKILILKTFDLQKNTIII